MTLPSERHEDTRLQRDLNKLIRWATALLTSGGAVPTSRKITAGKGLTGGGDLSADRTINMGTPGTLSSSSTNAVTADSHTHAITGVIVGLATPATSTSWDGDAKDSDNNGIIDLSSVFGLPSGIKGVFVKFSVKNTSTAGKWAALGPSSSSRYSIVQTPRDTLDIWLSNGPVFVPCDANGDVYFSTNAAHGAENSVAIQIYGYLV